MATENGPHQTIPRTFTLIQPKALFQEKNSSESYQNSKKIIGELDILPRIFSQKEEIEYSRKNRPKNIFELD